MASARFWEKAGFRVGSSDKGKRGGWFSPEAIAILREQAVAAGLDPDVAETWRMRMDLT